MSVTLVSARSARLQRSSGHSGKYVPARSSAPPAPASRPGCRTREAGSRSGGWSGRDWTGRRRSRRPRRPRRHQRVREQRQQLTQQIRTGLRQRLPQHPGRVDTRLDGHRGVLPRVGCERSLEVITRWPSPTSGRQAHRALVHPRGHRYLRDCWDKRLPPKADSSRERFSGAAAAWAPAAATQGRGYVRVTTPDAMP